jgi:transcription elongation factor Elf1
MNGFVKASVQQRYISGPSFCPFCEADEVVASTLESFDTVAAYQSVRCGECGTEWHNLYKLVGFEEVVAGDE